MLFPQLLLSLVAALPSPQLTEPNLVEVLFDASQGPLFVDSQGVTWDFNGFEELDPTPRGGWAARIRLAHPNGFWRAWILVGQAGGALDGPVQVLRSPLPSAPLDVRIYDGAYGGGRVVTVEKHFGAGGLAAEVRINGQIYLRSLDPVVAAPGWIWSSFNKVEVARGGGLFVVGWAMNPVNGEFNLMVTNEGTGQMLMNGLDFVPGLNRRVLYVEALTPSPSGQHWSAAVHLRNTIKSALIVNGAAYEPEPGHPMITEDPIPPVLASHVGNGVWDEILSCSINDAGDVALNASVRSSLGELRLTLLNGKLMEFNPISEDVRGVGLTDDGVTVYRTPLGLRTHQNELVDVEADVDLDRDGVADPLWRLRQVFRVARVASDEFIHATGNIYGTLGSATVVLRARRPDASDTICTGLHNSSGRPGSLAAVGSNRPSSNELALEVFDLPPAQPGYALFSRNVGPPVQPGGSSGELCLAGAIGRLVGQVFVTSELGTANITLDLTALPQPNGAVPALAGQTWYSQAWHRDTLPAGVATTNFTDAIVVRFL